MTHALLVATTHRFPVLDDEIAAAGAIAGWLELRADLTGDVEAASLRAHFNGPLLYTIGTTTYSRRERRRRLREAASSWDLVTLESDDLVDSVLRAIPPEKRVVAWRGSVSTLDELRDHLHRLSATSARLYVLEVNARTMSEHLLPIELLHVEKRNDVVAFASGTSGVWTRPLAARLGAPVVFGCVGDAYSADGTPPLSRLVDDFCLPELWPVRELFAMAGNPVTHSFSPRIHNAAYRALGRDALYVAFQASDFATFWYSIVSSEVLDRLGIPLRGISVVSPFKAAAVGAAKQRSRMVERAQSTNVLRREGDTWIAETTDSEGVMLTLRDHPVVCRDRRAAVIGCGGSGRAMAAALSDAGAHVTVVNRGLERGSKAGKLLDLPFVPLSEFDPAPYSIFVNATPVGRDADEIPFALENLRRDAVVVDLVYRDGATPLIARTRGPGRVTVDGTEMLLAQAALQFQLMTGEEMPEGLARQAIGLSSERVAAGQG